ncbi:acyl-ACP desaturase [Microbispora triticiradicis]|uniref:acyl-ACP desaturase n=1 Tax=Microbispora triticiradicis TaxID=2200763 RepID=UPI001FCE1408|nr:acyl-ACP desaturase [Microbispora triticiradicis]
MSQPARPPADSPGPRRRRIRNEGVYDLRPHLDDVLMRVLRQWPVFDETGLGTDGEKAREELAAFLAKTEATAARFVERWEERRARAAAAR